MNDVPGDEDVMAALEAEAESREQERVYRDLWEGEEAEPTPSVDWGDVDDEF